MTARRDFLRQVLPIGALGAVALNTDFFERVVAAGGAVRQAPWSNPEEGIQLAQLTDTEGNGFMLSQSIERD